MAVSISFGIAYATLLTLIILPIFLSFSNRIKTNVKWLATGNKITKEEVERAIKEKIQEEEELLLSSNLTASTLAINTGNEFEIKEKNQER